METQDAGLEKVEKCPDEETGLVAAVNEISIHVVQEERGTVHASECATKDKLSHHKQVETLLNEEHMVGEYMAPRPLSLRRSQSSEGLSPLLSKEDLSAMKPTNHAATCGNASTRFTNKVIHQEDPEEDGGVEEGTAMAH